MGKVLWLYFLYEGSILGVTRGIIYEFLKWCRERASVGGSLVVVGSGAGAWLELWSEGATVTGR